ncbi:MAG: ATP-binding protein [Nitrospirota bacterium]
MLIDRFKRSFSFKVFKAFAYSIMIVSAVFTTFFIYYQSNAAKEKLTREGRMLADLLARSSRTGVFAENSDLLKDAVQGIMSQRNVLSVTIYSDNMNVLYFDWKERHGKSAADISGHAGENTASGQSISRSYGVVERKDTIEFLSPVILELPSNVEEALYFDNVATGKTEKIIGQVKVVMDKHVLREEMTSILLRNVLIATVFIFSGAIIIYISIKRVTRPLRSLTEAARSLGMGESVEKVPVESTDEIGNLATAFNIMSENLRKREEEKQILEGQLRHAQKMEAVGTLARGIAHDFNNILATVRGAIYILEKKFDEHNPLRRYIQQIHNSITRAKKLIQGLLVFSRTQSINTVPVDINNLIITLKPMLAGIAGDKIELEILCSEEALIIKADAVQMEQVLMNLCMNAKDAMPDGGLLRIETRKVSGAGMRDAAYALRGGTGLEPGIWKELEGDFCEISVSDTGTGIDDEIKERIFEPFFTTKEVGKGTGLGLAIVYGIIEQHYGYINLHTQKGEGTVFRIWLPLIQDTAEDTGMRRDDFS